MVARADDPLMESVWSWEEMWSFGEGCGTLEYIYIAEKP